MQMNPDTGLAALAAAVISLALVLYTVGVFAERRSGALRPRHLALFWAGLACDTAGTSLMSLVAGAGGGTGSRLHTVTGGAALALMLFHAVWASVVVMHGNGRARENFHRLSIGVWLFWLVPYGVGALIGMPMLHLSDSAALVAAATAVLTLGVFLCLKANRRRRTRH